MERQLPEKGTEEEADLQRLSADKDQAVHDLRAELAEANAVKEEQNQLIAELRAQLAGQAGAMAQEVTQPGQDGSHPIEDDRK